MEIKLPTFSSTDATKAKPRITTVHFSYTLAQVTTPLRIGKLRQGIRITYFDNVWINQLDHSDDF